MSVADKDSHAELPKSHSTIDSRAENNTQESEQDVVIVVSPQRIAAGI
jgi:hypothetical protein